MVKNLTIQYSYIGKQDQAKALTDQIEDQLKELNALLDEGYKVIACPTVYIPTIGIMATYTLYKREIKERVKRG